MTICIDWHRSGYLGRESGDSGIQSTETAAAGLDCTDLLYSKLGCIGMYEVTGEYGGMGEMKSLCEIYTCQEAAVD